MFRINIKENKIDHKILDSFILRFSKNEQERMTLVMNFDTAKELFQEGEAEGVCGKNHCLNVSAASVAICNKYPYGEVVVFME